MKRAERLDDLEEGMRLALDNALAHTWCALPGIIQGVDLGRQTCSVQPAITGTVMERDGKKKAVQLPMLVDVPLVFPRAGGFALTFPVRAGDECLVIFADRCIDAWWQYGKVSAPVEQRFHDLSDGFAILAPTSQPKKLSGVSSSAVQMRTEGGQTFVEVDAAGNITLKGNVRVRGYIECNGTNISDTHVHGGVQGGSSNTGTPQ